MTSAGSREERVEFTRGCRGLPSATCPAAFHTKQSKTIPILYCTALFIDIDADCLLDIDVDVSQHPPPYKLLRYTPATSLCSTYKTLSTSTPKTLGSLQGILFHGCTSRSWSGDEKKTINTCTACSHTAAFAVEAAAHAVYILVLTRVRFVAFFFYDFESHVAPPTTRAAIVLPQPCELVKGGLAS